jgi:prophage antirepressor-like protein
MTEQSNSINAGIVSLVFEHKPVRVVAQNDGPWFVAADVCRVLELDNVAMAIRILDPDEKGVNTVDTLGGPQQMSMVSEPGLYKLLGRSRKPEAKRFDRWVRHEVLPSIRKHGGYMVAAQNETPEELALRALTVLQATVERQKAQIAIAQPKADALDRIAISDGALGLIEAAKALQLRPKDLIGYLSTNGWIYRRPGGACWLGYQARTSSGDLEHKVTTITRTDGPDKVVEQVKITPKGLVKLAGLFGAQSATLFRRLDASMPAGTLPA